MSHRSLKNGWLGRWLFATALGAALYFCFEGTASAQSSNAFTDALAKGPLYAAMAAFAGGFLVSLTPCVYPMVAVTVSVFGAGKSTTRARGAALSGLYVLGIAAFFTPMGVLVGMSGSAMTISPWMLVALAVVFTIMAASMFGAFDLALPSSINNRLAEMGGLGFKGAFVLGLICGPIAAPCTGPVLTGILAWIGTTGDPLLGAGAMLAFSLGLGIPFFLVGAFAMQLPKSGSWMMHVKSVFGIVLLVAALYFLGSAYPVLTSFARPTMAFFLASAGVLVFGLAIGAVHQSFSGSLSSKARKSLGIALSVGAMFAVITGLLTPERTLVWEKTSPEAARAKALGEGRPLLVDFTAAWCIACKELDKNTFADESVAAEAGRFVAVKVDATDDEDPAVVKAMQQFEVLGLPTVVIFDSSGKEAARFNDFVAADSFLDTIRSVN